MGLGSDTCFKIFVGYIPISFLARPNGIKPAIHQFQANYRTFSFFRVYLLYLEIFLDDYFVSNIEKVDSVTLLRKDKLLNKTSLNMG